MVGPVRSSARGHLLGERDRQPPPLRPQSRLHQLLRLHTAGQEFFKLSRFVRKQYKEMAYHYLLLLLR